MKTKKLWSGLLAVLLMLGLFSGMKKEVYAEEITAVTAEMSIDPTIACQEGKSVVLPEFITTSGGPAVVEAGSCQWEKNGDYTEDTVFTKGVWELWVPVVLDGAANPGYSLSEAVTLTVDGVAWELYSFYPGTAEDPEWIAWFRYPGSIDLTGGALNFVRNADWDIPQSQVGIPITPFSVASGVTGGTPSYTFGKESGPSWIDVDMDGNISGTPSVGGMNEDLVIKVRDAKGDEAKITLWVDPTKLDEREAITGIEAVCKSPEEAAVYGKTAESLGFTVTTAGVAGDASSETWQKYDEEKGEWKSIPFGTAFSGGDYRYKVKCTADSLTYSFLHPSLFVDYEGFGEEWNLDFYSSWEAWAVFTSPEYTASSPVETITVSGVVPPVAGELPQTGSETVKEDGLILEDAHWFRKEGTELVPADSDPFEAGYDYYIDLLFLTAGGYAFADSVFPSVNGMTPPSARTDYVADEGMHVIAFIPFAVGSVHNYVVTAGSLNVRGSASSYGERIGGLKYGDFVAGIYESGNFVGFDFEGTNAWVNKNYLALTYTKETAIPPMKYKVTVGALNVREMPGEFYNRIGGLTYDKEILVTGRLTAGDGKEWLVLDYDGQLGFIRASYASSEAPEEEKPVVDTGEAAKEEEEEDELFVDTGVPAKVTIVPKMAVSTGNTVSLTEDCFGDSGDGGYLVTVYPDDARSFASLTADKIVLPEETKLTVLSLTRNEDGSIELKLGVMSEEPEPEPEPEPEVSYTFSKGADASWTKGSSDGVALTVNREPDDDKTFSLFEKIEVDGKTLTAEAYTASSGSLNATIKATYLETLSAGSHTLKISFADGSAETSLTIREKVPAGKNTPVPNTGDTSDTSREEGFILLAGLVLIAVLFNRKRIFGR